MSYGGWTHEPHGNGERSAAYAAANKTPQPNVSVGDKVRVLLSEGLRASKGFRTRAIEGTVKAVTPKAMLINGTAGIWKADRCLRCGRAIVRPESTWTGYGPDCSDMLGIEWDCPEEQRAEQEAKVRALWSGETWVPRFCKTTIVEQGNGTSGGNGVPSVTGDDGVKRAVMPDARLTLETLDVDKAHGEYIVCRSLYKHAEICRSVARKVGGARWNPNVTPWPGEGDKNGAWIFSPQPFIAYELKRAFDGMNRRGNSAFVELVKQHEETLEKRTASAEHKTATDLPDIPNMKHSAWQHQRQAYWFAVEQRACMLSMDMGTGKSFVSVALVMNRKHAATLILAPKRVVETVWHKQFAEHAGADYVLVSLHNGGTAKDKQKLAAAKMAEAKKLGKPFICVVNYETARLEDFAAWSLKAGFDFVIYDESHKIKQHDGAAAKYCGQLAKVIPWKLALTGTPMPHSPLDVWSQYRALDISVFGTSFTAFRARYAVMGGYLGKQIIGWQNQDDLHTRFYSIAYRVTKDVLDLPPVRHEVIECKLGKEAAAIYKSLEDDFVGEVEEGEVTASNALVKLLRLAQITSGFVKIDESGLERTVDTAKADALADIMDGIALDEPLVVFCRFHHDLDAIQAITEKTGRRYAELSGRKRRDVAGLTDWQAGDADVIAVQIQSGGAGIDLTRAHYCVYYSVGFSLGDYDQSLARVHRPGQMHATTYYHLTCVGTVDVKIYTALSNRRNVVESVLSEYGAEGIDVDDESDTDGNDDYYEERDRERQEGASAWGMRG